MFCGPVQFLRCGRVPSVLRLQQFGYLGTLEFQDPSVSKQNIAL